MRQPLRRAYAKQRVNTSCASYTSNPPRLVVAQLLNCSLNPSLAFVAILPATSRIESVDRQRTRTPKLNQDLSSTYTASSSSALTCSYRQTATASRAVCFGIACGRPLDTILRWQPPVIEPGLSAAPPSLFMRSEGLKACESTPGSRLLQSLALLHQLLLRVC